MKIVSNNKKAYFDFEISDKLEAGVILEGWEVKSVKAGSMSLSSAFVKEKNGELYLSSSFISSWRSGFQKTKEEEGRDRKLLVKKSEIKQLVNKSKASRYTIVPLEVYINNQGMIKITIALARGKKKYDKRLRIKERDLKRDLGGERKRFNI